MHHWVVDVDLTESLLSKENSAKRDDMNNKLIGSMVQVPVIIVQGIEITKPSWFRKADVNLDQMMLPRRKR